MAKTKIVGIENTGYKPKFIVKGEQQEFVYIDMPFGIIHMNEVEIVDKVFNSNSNALRDNPRSNTNNTN